MSYEIVRAKSGYGRRLVLGKSRTKALALARAAAARCKLRANGFKTVKVHVKKLSRTGGKRSLAALRKPKRKRRNPEKNAAGELRRRIVFNSAVTAANYRKRGKISEALRIERQIDKWCRQFPELEDVAQAGMEQGGLS